MIVKALPKDLNTYPNNVYVAHRYGDYDIYTIFLTKEEADVEAETKTNTHKTNFPNFKQNPYVGMTLTNAIDQIKELVRDDVRQEEYERH